MSNLKVIDIRDEIIFFEDGICLYSHHDQDCCEQHSLTLNDLSVKDFEGLEFDLSNDDFFTRIEDYGISLNPVNGWPIRIPCHGWNNGYYSSDLTLCISKDDELIKTYDISECQDICWG